MLVFITVAIMGAVAYSSLRDGLLSALCTLVNVLLAGLVAFNFYEPLANELEGMLQGTILNGFEDSLVLFALFGLSMGALRTVTNSIAPNDVELPALFTQVGSILISLVTGYLLAGFLVCLFQTIPWGEKFLGFDHTFDPAIPKTRSLIPPDRVWLAMMHRGSLVPLSQEGGAVFDPDGTFELRYARLRRFKEQP